MTRLWDYFRRRPDHRAEPVEHSDLSPEPVPLAKAWEAPRDGGRK